MDYSIGSLSDLITGSITPNKTKVIKKKMTLKNSPTSTPTPALEASSDADEQSIDPRPKLKAKKSKQNKKTHTATPALEASSDADEQSIDSPPKQKAKKSKLVNKESPVANGSSVGEPLNIKPSKAGTKRKANGDDNESNAKKGKNAQNAERRVSYKNVVEKENAEKEPEDPEIRSRTIYVGNIPITFTTQKLKRLFSKYGKVETVRFRGVPIADPKTSKKLAMIKKKFHPDRKSFYGFVRFEERADAEKACLEANGMVLGDHHLRVNLCDDKEKPDSNKAIFVGNLSFRAEEEDLRKVFESCGNIMSVRIVRDSKTGMGKGFGYVNFEQSDSVTLALEMENVTLNERELRINICNNNAKKNGQQKNMKIKKPRSPKKEKAEGTQGSENGGEDAANKPFQGVQLVQKKKKKLNKGSLDKKKMIKKVAPKEI